MRSNRVAQRLEAPPVAVDRALLDTQAVARWTAPDGMTSEVHEFDAHEGGVFRVSLTNVERSAAGKTAAHSDTYHGRFIRPVPNREVIEVVEFETHDPALRGEMHFTMRLDEADGPISLPFMTICQRALLRKKTSRAGKCPWRSSRRSSRLFRSARA